VALKLLAGIIPSGRSSEMRPVPHVVGSGVAAASATIHGEILDSMAVVGEHRDRPKQNVDQVRRNARRGSDGGWARCWTMFGKQA